MCIILQFCFSFWNLCEKDFCPNWWGEYNLVLTCLMIGLQVEIKEKDN